MPRPAAGDPATAISGSAPALGYAGDAVIHWTGKGGTQIRRSREAESSREAEKPN